MTSRWYFSLRTTVLATLAIIQIVFLVAALGGLDRFLGGFFEQAATSSASQLVRTIKAGLRQQMLREPAAGVEGNLEDLRQVNDVQRVWVIDKNGRVAYATDRPSVGRVLDRHRAPACVVCHTPAGLREGRTAFETNDAGVPIIRFVDVVANEPACQSCHDPKQRVNGIILVEQSTEAFRTALGTVRTRLGITLGATLIALVGTSFLALTVLVLRPVTRLRTGVARLGTGDLSVRVPVTGRGELAELADAFNGMAGDLDRHVEEIRNKTTELSIVYAILGRLTKSIDLSELRDIVLQAFLQVFRAQQAVLVSRTEGQTLPDAVWRTQEESRTRRIRPDSRGDVILPTGFPDDALEGWRGGQLQTAFVTADRHVAVLPIATALGTSLLLMIRREAPFTEPETNAKLLSMVAEHVGAAFNNAELYSQAITDELTQLFTVRHFYDQLDDCVNRHAREGRVFSLLMIDLDAFKSVNDTWGHLAGDAVLREVAAVLRNSVRLPDSSYRYGGDEMAILLPGAGIAAAREVAERLQQGIEQMRVTIDGGEVLRVTASIGFAACPEHGASGRELVAAADAALLSAKSAGRNRTAEAMPSA